MVWASISATGRIKLCFISKKMNGSDYRYMLRREILPFWRRNRQKNLVFQQDGAPIHRARRTISWIQARKIAILEWPACSPDLNIIENVWGFMVHKIYEGNKIYNNVNELKKAIVEAWKKVDQSLLDNLYLSMDTRLFQLTRRAGGPVDY